VRRYLNGDRPVGDDLVRKFAPLVRAIVQRVLGPDRREEWEDACQAVFLRVFARLGTWRAQCPFCKWLAVVAARRAVDCLDLHQPFVSMKAEEVTDPRPADALTLTCIRSCVASWPPERQELFNLMLQGLSREEMAARLGKSVRTVQYWLTAVRDELQDCLPD
jgi:RNA polymerase sigma-70 factor (ECF subfamily)